MITDLFSHKIHSSGPEWQDKLVELASIFAEFDGKPFDRAAIERRLASISPRVAYAAAEIARDPSKFRDEISAYPAYLGLYFLQYEHDRWILRVSETARTFLVSDEPDVSAFMRLQLPLFQYPSGMGVVYSGEGHVQANARDKTLELVHAGVHFSPFRMICNALIADSVLRNVGIFEAQLSFSEIYALANCDAVNQTVSPSQAVLMETLVNIRDGRIIPPPEFESRFHILDHTEMFTRGSASLTLREPENELDAADLTEKINAIAEIDNQFNGFDHVTDGESLVQVIRSGTWGNYFDGIRTLPGHIIAILAKDMALAAAVSPRKAEVLPEMISATPSRYSLRDHTGIVAPRAYTRHQELADPEATRIKRERRNLAHKEMLSSLDEFLRNRGANPQENPHIDLYAEVPNDGAYLFEIKSGGENLLAQIRKGVSQLYEYRFRYEDDIRSDTILCLVLPHAPITLPWVEEYLCNDRDIALCWINDEGNVIPAPLAANQLEDFINAPLIPV